VGFFGDFFLFSIWSDDVVASRVFSWSMFDEFFEAFDVPFCDSFWNGEFHGDAEWDAYFVDF